MLGCYAGFALGQGRSSLIRLLVMTGDSANAPHQSDDIVQRLRIVA
jgi:hypothetical protein